MFVCLCVLTGHAQSAILSPREKWVKSLAEAQSELKNSATSYLNLNDMAYLEMDQTIYLDLKAPHEKALWLKELPKSADYLEISRRKDGVPAVRRPSGETFDLVNENDWRSASGLVIHQNGAARPRVLIGLHDPRHPKQKEFISAPYFSYNSGAVIAARFHKAEPFEPIEFITTRDEKKKAHIVGRLLFRYAKKDCVLEAYSWANPPDETKEIFIPFKDATTGRQTYGGGRYLDSELLQGLQSERVVLDFNYAYNPACVRSPFFNCVLVRGNRLPVAMDAGEKAPFQH